MNETKRDWEERFAPPPPPPLPAKATGAADEPARRPLAAVADEQRATDSGEQDPQNTGGQGNGVPGHEASDTAAATVRAEEPESCAPPDQPDAGTSANLTNRTDRDQANKLLAALTGPGLDVSLTGVRRQPSGVSYEIAVGGPDSAQQVVLMAGELSDLLEVAEVRVTTTQTAGTVRVDVLREPGPGDVAWSMSVWVPVEVREAATVEKDRVGESFTDYFLGAFNRQYDKFDTYFTRRLATPGPMTQKQTRRRRDIKTRVQLWLYLNTDQRQILDDSVASSGAGSRSALVTRLMEEDLDVTVATK